MKTFKMIPVLFLLSSLAYASDEGKDAYKELFKASMQDALLAKMNDDEAYQSFDKTEKQKYLDQKEKGLVRCHMQALRLFPKSMRHKLFDDALAMNSYEEARVAFSKSIIQESARDDEVGDQVKTAMGSFEAEGQACVADVFADTTIAS